MSQNPALRQPVPVGKYFLERGRITEQQLELALKHRASFGLKLGQSLVELGFVDESDMVEALRHQARFPCIHLTPGIVSSHVANKLGEEVSRRLRALGLNQIAGHTTVALEDPSDDRALEELSHLLATRIFPVFAEPSAILANIDRVFALPRSAKRAMEAAQAAQAVQATQSAQPVAPERRAESSSGPVRGPTAAAHAKATSNEGEAVPDERAVVERVRSFLQDAFTQGVSDIHLEPRKADTVVRFRVDGALREHSRMSGALAEKTIACLKALAKLDSDLDADGVQEGRSRAPAAGSISFVFKEEQLELGVSLTPSRHGDSVVLHVSRNELRLLGLGELGLVDDQLTQVELALRARGGLFVVSGPGGSGRSTTLHAMLAHVAAPDRKLIALEPIVRREHEHVLHVQMDARERLATQLRELLGQDPDVLLASEIDGRETAQVLFEAARSGRTALSTLRASGAVETLTNLARLGLEPYLLADAVGCIIAQRLVRRVCTDCRSPIVPDEALRGLLGLAKDGAAFFDGEGCPACHGTGYRGRIALFEVLRVTPAVRYELEKGGDGMALMRAARADGFTSLREQGLRQARSGVTTLHEVLAVTPRA